MTDPVEAALRAIEAKYLPRVTEGKSLMPFYPRDDVAVMIDAAVRAERNACIAEALTKERSEEPMPCPDGMPGCLVYHRKIVERPRTANEIAAYIRARG